MRVIVAEHTVMDCDRLMKCINQMLVLVFHTEYQNGDCALVNFSDHDKCMP